LSYALASISKNPSETRVCGRPLKQGRQRGLCCKVVLWARCRYGLAKTGTGIWTLLHGQSRGVSFLRSVEADVFRGYHGGCVMPFKFHSKGRRHIPRQRYRVTNWREYDAALRNRGSLTIWFTPDAIAGWKAQPRTRRAVSVIIRISPSKPR
jgi:hypothetical protein